MKKDLLRTPMEVSLPPLIGDSQMVTSTKKRPAKVAKTRFIGKPTGQIQDRVAQGRT